MKKWQNLSLHLKLLACFLAAIFVLSIVHLISYARLLTTMKLEAEGSANERMTSAVTRLDESLAQIRNTYFSLTYTTAYRTASASGAPSEYEQLDLFNQSKQYFAVNPQIAAYAILFRNSDRVVTSSGNYTEDEFFGNFYSSGSYTADFWSQEKTAAFAQRYYPAAGFLRNSVISGNENIELLPVAFKSYWNSNVMVVLFLDIRQITAEADLYLTESFYLFDADGGLLYSSEEEPVWTSLPEQAGARFESYADGYISRRPSGYGNFICVKQLPKSTVVGQITNSLYFSLFTVLAALALGIFVSAVSVRQVLHPMQEILRLFGGDGSRPDGRVDELQYIQTNVETVLRQREQYVQQLSEKDAALSDFLLQSQLKNIYVKLDAMDNTPPAGEGVFYILYFRIHYRDGALESISQQPAVVSHMLLETIQHTLSLLFDTALIFQLEPTQFVAKVSLPADRQEIDSEMEYLLRWLDNEREFAFFTVVQGMPLTADGDFTAVYEQVLDAAQYAKVENETQFLRLPLELDTANIFTFPAEQEQQLRALVQGGQAEEAAALAQQILAQNLAQGIRHIHMILLCSAVISAVLRVLSDLHLENLPSLNSSSVYNALPHCDTAGGYQELVAGFVRSSALCAASRPRAEDSVLVGVQTFLEKNYRQEFSMDELAEALHLSKSYLSSYYKGKTGVNLSDRIQFYRIQKAVELLADPKLRVGEIGAAVGISNVNTFLRQFKKYTGMTPTEYRAAKFPPQ